MDSAGSDASAEAAAREISRKSYDAFISYAHDTDREFAPVVQRGLQKLAKPWNRRRAMEVFRDETSLAVSPGACGPAYGTHSTRPGGLSCWLHRRRPGRAGWAKRSLTGFLAMARIIC